MTDLILHFCLHFSLFFFLTFSQQKQRVAIVVAHELAHQWFGKCIEGAELSREEREDETRTVDKRKEEKRREGKRREEKRSGYNTTE